MAYGFSRIVTIDKTKVPNTDQVNFPVLFSGTYAYLATVANGGNVTNASGFDIIFTSDAAGATKLDHEIESYSPTTGAVNFWVRVPTVSFTVDTVIYLWYGNAAITTSQENVTGVWDANFKGVYHLKDGTTLSAVDSIAGNNGTINGATAAASKIDGGASIVDNDITIQYIALPAGLPRMTTPYTVSLWYKPNTLTPTNIAAELTTDWSGPGRNFILEQFNSTINVVIGNGGTLQDVGFSGGVLTTTAFHSIVLVVNGTSHIIYVNGAIAASQTGAHSGGTTSTVRHIGADFSLAVGYGARGIIDEVRFAATNRSADWITTEYNNQNSPSTFYAVGGPTVLLTGVAGTSAIGAAAVALSLALSGLSASGEVGSFTTAYGHALTGVTGTGSVGAPSPSTSIATTGNMATGVAGVVATVVFSFGTIIQATDRTFETPSGKRIFVSEAGDRQYETPASRR